MVDAFLKVDLRAGALINRFALERVGAQSLEVASAQSALAVLHVVWRSAVLVVCQNTLAIFKLLAIAIASNNMSCIGDASVIDEVVSSFASACGARLLRVLIKARISAVAEEIDDLIISTFAVVD